jgi:homogentisate 1,2-dioxygenase
MPYYTRMGHLPDKRHTQFRRSDGELYTEEVVGAEGFSGISAIAYHIHQPTIVDKIGDSIPYDVEYVDKEFLQHRHIKGWEVEAGGDWLTSRTYLMGNNDVRLAIARPTTNTDDYFYRNASCDELVYVHEGEGTLETMLGSVDFTDGDYVHVPRTITHQWRFDGDLETNPPRLLVIESESEVRFPKKYRNEFGQLLEHSPYCERDVRPPSELPTIDEEGPFEIRIKKHGKLHRYWVRYHPFDVVGWDGYMYPYAISIHDFEPITGRIHQPPPVHQMFEAHNYVVCSFVPRLFDYHPDSIPAPYNHSNIDSDEVLFYAEGDFMSRKGISRGSFSLHPGGIPHGPHPGTAEASIGKEGTEELAVMVDTFHPLKLTQAALDVEDPDYAYSWQPERHASGGDGQVQSEEPAQP